MDARSRVRRILWGTLRGTLPAARALTMMVRWEADFAPAFERDPVATMTGFLQHELGSTLQAAECALLADRILTIMDEFSGALPQDPIASIRRLSEQRLGVEPASVVTPVDPAPVVAMPVDAVAPDAVVPEVVAPEIFAPDTVMPEVGAVEPVATDHAGIEHETGEHRASEYAAGDARPGLVGVSEQPLIWPPVAQQPLIPPVAQQPLISPIAQQPFESASVVEAAESKDNFAPGPSAGNAEAQWHGSAILPPDRYLDPDPVEPIKRRTEQAGLPAFGSEKLFDDDLDPDPDVEHLRAPHGFERARTLEILPPTGANEAYRLSPVEIEAEAEPEFETVGPLLIDIPPPPSDQTATGPLPTEPEAPAPTAGSPSARYGIDRSVFSKIFLEHD